MLDIMRKHAKNWIMKLLLGIIIIVFVFYFGSLKGRDQADVIATLDGESLYYVDFEQEYQNLQDRYRQQLGNLSRELLKGLKLKEQAFDNLINQAVIIRKAKELNIRVSDDELRNSILSYPSFQQDGTFNQRLYQQTLRLNRMTPESFENRHRRLLIIKKLQELLLQGVHVSDQDVYNLYRLQNGKISIEFIKLPMKSYIKELKPTPQELETYFKEHSNEFRVPEQFKVKYLTFPASDFISSVKVSEEQMKDFYERNKQRMAPEGQNPPAYAEIKEQIATALKQNEAMDIAAKKAKEAHDAIYQQENFDAYAQSKGLIAHSSPYFSGQDMPSVFNGIADFFSSILSLRNNEITSVLSDGTGYYLFQLTERKPSYIPDLKEAEKDVKLRYLENQAKLLAEKAATELLAELKKSESFTKAAQKKNLKVEQSGMFIPGSNIPNLGESYAFIDELIQLSESKPYPDKPLQVGDNFVIARFKERGQLDQKDFEAHKEELKKVYRELKENETLTLWVEGVKNSLIKEGKLKITREIKDT